MVITTAEGQAAGDNTQLYKIYPHRRHPWIVIVIGTVGGLGGPLCVCRSGAVLVTGRYED